MLFDHAFYKKNILTTFPEVSRNAAQMNLVITSTLSEAFDKHLPIIREKFIVLLQSSEHNVDKLLNEPPFIMTLTHNNIARRDMSSLTEQAIKSAMKLLDKPEAHLKI